VNRKSSAKDSIEPVVHYVHRNFDEAAILSVAAKLAFDQSPDFNESELATIAAMQRAHPSAGDSYEELGRWLASMDDDRISGVVSNTKGVLHEMEFVRIENSDGDSVHASIFESTNHPGYDVEFVDADTGAAWQAQLKATDSSDYVQSWIDDHPEGEILVTHEIAEAMGLPDSGLSNEELTARTEDVVDQLLEATEDSSLWDYFPGLTAVSISLVLWSLFQRYRKGEITLQRFQWLAAKATGIKAGKIALLTVAMMVPGLNVITGAALTVSLIYSGAEAVRTASAPKRSRSSDDSSPTREGPDAVLV
jgi:uncharacterized protein (DUF736 family)